MMKKINIALLTISFLYLAALHPAQQKKLFVIDQSGVFDSAQINKLNDLYLRHERLTSNQIVLLTTDDFYPDSTIEQYALHRFNTLGIGQREVNNGLLIVFSVPKRKLRIATGYGTAKVLTDSMAKQIIDSLMLPSFRQQKYFEGIWNASKAITDFLEKPENKIR